MVRALEFDITETQVLDLFEFMHSNAPLQQAKLNMFGGRSPSFQGAVDAGLLGADVGEALGSGVGANVHGVFLDSAQHLQSTPW